MESRPLGWVPDVCTLPTVDQPVRVAAFDELLSGSVVGVERPSATRLQLDLIPTPDIAAQVAELAARESSCCAFFSFALTIGTDRLRLDVDVPAAQTAVLDALMRAAVTPEESEPGATSGPPRSGRSRDSRR